MSAKILVAFGLLCLLQGFHCETVGEVIAEFRPKIRLLTAKASRATAEAGAELGLAIAETEAAKGKGLAEVASRLGLLRLAVEKAKKEAHQAGKNITRCVQGFEEAVKALNIGEIGKCSGAEELGKARRGVAALRMLVKDIARISRECLKDNAQDPAALRKCHQEALASGEKSVEENRKAVGDLSKAAVEKVKGCVDALVKSRVEALQKISDEFKKCVQAA